MNVKTKEIYSEVYQVLNLLGNDYINKLPTSLTNMISEKREVNYNPQYTADIPLNKQNIKKETMSIIVLLYLNYWCNDENEISEVKNILKKNEEKYQAEIKEKCNTDNIFKNHTQDVQGAEKIEQNVTNENEMIPYKQSIFSKIINGLKNIFHIK